MKELLNQTKALRPSGALNKTTASTMSRLELILSHINDFLTIIVLCRGAEAKIAALVWGSIQIVLTVYLTLTLQTKLTPGSWPLRQEILCVMFLICWRS